MEKVVGHKMTIDKKIDLIKNRIMSLDVHVLILENDILKNPDADHPDKMPRSIALEEIKRAIRGLQDLEISLTNQG